MIILLNCTYRMQFLGEHGLLHGLIKNMVMESYEIWTWQLSI